MVYKCCALGCRSGYAYRNHAARPQSISGVRITFHSFPRHEELREQWIRAISRKDFVPTRYSKMCSLHFVDSDFVEEHQDSNPGRRKKFASGAKLTRRYLKRDAVPSVFHNTSSSRRKQAADGLEYAEAEDSVASLTTEQIGDKLTSESGLPGGFQLTLVDDTLLIYRLQLVNSVPEVQASVTVRPDMTVAVAVKREQVPAARYRDILPGSLQTISQLLNVTARVGAWC